MKGYRSIVVNGLAAVAGFLSLPQITGLLPPGSEPYVVLALGIIAQVMRFVTSTPVGVPELERPPASGWRQ